MLYTGLANMQSVLSNSQQFPPTMPWPYFWALLKSKIEIQVMIQHSSLHPNFPIESRLCSYVPLMLRKPDERRGLTQRWRFTEGGRLMCSHHGLFVQAKDGFMGLRGGE